MADLHDCARILHRLDQLLDQVLPIIEGYAAAQAAGQSPIGMLRRARKEAKK